MSLDFAIKDFYRKRSQNFPYVLTIALTIALTIFIIYFSNALNLNSFVRQNLQFNNPFFFSGAINMVFSQFNTVLLVLIFILAVVMVIIISSSLIVSKKRDITIMKALGTLPEKLYSFYLVEIYIIYIFGFILGWILGIITFGIFSYVFSMFSFTIEFKFDIIFSLLLFILCSLGAISLPGYQLRKIGRTKVIKGFSKELPSDSDATSKLKLVPKWTASIGLNVKYAVLNLTRKRGKFNRYLIVFFTISLILFTAGLGELILSSSSSNWINKAQGNDIILIGHEDVVANYSSMYRMFSDPTISITNQNINFTNSKYLFNESQLEHFKNIDGIENIDPRLIDFSKVRELRTYKITEGGEYFPIGNDTEGTYPIIGLNSSNLIQEFEIEGNLFNSQNPADDNITIGDGLAYNFFEYPLDQEMQFIETGDRSSVSGIVIDTFYSGYAAYMDIDNYRAILNMSSNDINIFLIHINPKELNQIQSQLDTVIATQLGPNFTYLPLKEDFDANFSFLNYLSSYPLFLILLTSIISIFSIYHFQKGDLSEKLKDFLIMRSIGSKLINIGKILFLEALFTLIPAVFASLAGGIIINILFLFNRVSLPPLFIPFIISGLILGSLVLINLIMLIPILKRINQSSLRELKIF